MGVARSLLAEDTLVECADWAVRTEGSKSAERAEIEALHQCSLQHRLVVVMG